MQMELEMDMIWKPLLNQDNWGKRKTLQNKDLHIELLTASLYFKSNIS